MRTEDMTEALGSLGEACRRLDAALLALGPLGDKVMINEQLLELLLEAVSARRVVRRLQAAALRAAPPAN